MFYSLWHSIAGSLSMVLLQKLHESFHACSFLLICKLLWHPPCTNFVTPEVLVIDEVCRSIADVQLVYRVLPYSTFSSVHEMVGWSEQSSSTILDVPLHYLSIHWCTFLCVIQFSLYCANILLWILEGFTPSGHKNQMTACCSTVVQSEIEADMFTLWFCISFTGCNGCPMTCHDVTEYLVYVMFERV